MYACLIYHCLLVGIMLSSICFHWDITCNEPCVTCDLCILFPNESKQIVLQSFNIVPVFFQLPPVYVSRTWYQQEVLVSYNDVGKYATMDKTEADKVSILQ